MRQNASKVIEGFKAGEAAAGDAKRTISTDGKTIFSYAMPICRCNDAGTTVSIVNRAKGPSATTRSHITACMIAFPQALIVDSL